MNLTPLAILLLKESKMEIFFAVVGYQSLAHQLSVTSLAISSLSTLIVRSSNLVKRFTIIRLLEVVLMIT